MQRKQIRKLITWNNNKLIKCELCPRKCGIDRNKSAGFCGAKNLKIAKIMKRFWEEPIISGKNGSGAIIFSQPFTTLKDKFSSLKSLKSNFSMQTLSSVYSFSTHFSAIKNRISQKNNKVI